MRHLIRPVSGLVLATLALVLPGCGTATYNNNVTQRIASLRAEAPFRSLFGPTELPETTIKIRVPLVLTSSYLPDSSHPDDGPRIDRDRVQPPFLSLPGFKICYEGIATNDANVKLPFYCYLAAIPAKSGDGAKLKEALQTELKAKFKETPDAWEDTDAVNPDGKPLRWTKLRVVSDQAFRYRDNSDKVVSTPFPAIFELWLYESVDWLVLVGWRSPVSLDTVPPPPVAVGGTAVPAPPGAAARPNLSTMPALVAGTLTIDGASPVPAETGG